MKVEKLHVLTMHIFPNPVTNGGKIKEKLDQNFTITLPGHAGQVSHLHSPLSYKFY